MIYKIEIYFMLFIIYAFLGWVMECTLGIIEKRKFINRGFLIGPYCPIYGVGVVSVTLLLSRFSNNIILLFILSTILCGLLEYFTGYIMEKIFNARWWDYSDSKFNINGRVCLNTLIPFGIICVLIICFANPWILSKLYTIPQNSLHCIVIFLLLIYLIDTIISFKIILNFKNVTRQAKDNTEEISKKVKETIENIDDTIKNSIKDMSEKIKNSQVKLRKELKEKFASQSKLNRRLISAFPDVQQWEYTRKKKKIKKDEDKDV